MMSFESLPNAKRNTYKFNEVTSVTGVKPYVLRFWESEFEQISPRVLEGGHKIYAQADLEAIQKIKTLLFEEKLSIPQAKSFFDDQKRERQAKELNQDDTTQQTDDRKISSNVAFQYSTLEMVQSALAKDFEAQQITSTNQPVKSFSDQDVLNLVQAKKKLNTALSKLDQIITENRW